ncbi:MAG: hypothetical protein AAF725_03440 [Acidobacteriota bacterium]
MSSNRVSTFENLVKPIADPSAPFVRTVVSGYFLNFTNLGSDSDFRALVVIPSFTNPGAPGESLFDREFTVSDAQGGPQNDPNSTQGNHNVIFDVTGGVQGGQTAVGELTFLGATACAKVYWSDRFRLCRGATAQLALLPNLGPFGPPLIADDRLEIRGWLALGRVGVSISGISRAFQALVTPEQRGTFLPVGINTGVDPVDLSNLSQLNTSLPVAGGGGSLIDLITPGQPPNNVVAFAQANGIDINELRCFSDVLRTVV